MAVPSHEEQWLIDAMKENPTDLSLRIVFADFLEQRGNPCGELVRLTHTLTQSIVIANRAVLEDRLRGLLREGVQPIGPFWTNSLGMKFAWIPPGTFMMGSPKDEANRSDNEAQHMVTLTKGFYMGVHAVTQDQRKAVMRTKAEKVVDMVNNTPPINPNEKTLPAEEVSWDYCQRYTMKLEDTDKKPYRLPTEAEWEFACRAGTTTPFYFGENIAADQVNYEGNSKNGVSEKRTTPVGSFPGNAYGLFDMHGNVFEWCQDWYGEYPQRAVVDPQGPENGSGGPVFRGGSCRSLPRCCRSAYRGRKVLGVRSTDHVLGFRLCFSVE